MQFARTQGFRATVAVFAALAAMTAVAITASPGSVHAATNVPHDLGACTAFGSAQPAKDGNGRYYAGASADLSATGLAAGTAVRLFYNGPRGTGNGATEQSARQYTAVGTYTVLPSGALHVHVTIPEDAAPGTGHVLAYTTAKSKSGNGLLSRAIRDWPVPVTYHKPWVTLSGEPGQTLDLKNVANGDTCHALIPADGETTIVANAPGLWDVGVQARPDVPHEVHPFVYGGVQVMPGPGPLLSFLNGCHNVRFRAFDYFSGTPSWVSQAGGPPFGYFLSRSNTPDPIAIVATAYDANGVPIDLSETCVETINALKLRQITPNPGGGTTTKLLPNSGLFVAPHPTIQSFGVPFGARLCALGPCPGGNPTSAWDTVAIPSDIYSRVFLTQIGLTSLPAGTEGTGTLTMTDAFNTAQTFGTIKLIAHLWEASPLFSGANPVFHTNTRSYNMVETAANVPALGTNNNYAGPNVNFGWGGVPYLGNSSWSFNTQVKTFYALQEGFSTDGVWSAVGSSYNSMNLFGQVIYPGQASAVGVTTHNPYRPTYGFDRPNAATWSKPGLIDTSIPVGGISIGNWNIGVDLNIKVDASAALGVSGSVGQHLNTFATTFTPSGSLHGFASLGLESGPFGVAFAIDGWMTLAIPISDVVPTGWQASYCLTGELDWGIWYSWDLGWFFGSGSGWWAGPYQIVGPGTIAGTCPVAFSQTKVFHRRLSAAAKARLRSQGYKVLQFHGTPPTPPMASEDFDSAHHGSALWVEPQGDHGALMAAPWKGTGWGTPVTVATDAQAIGSPRVVELGDGRAVAAWREVMPFGEGDKDLLATYQQNHDYNSASRLVASHAEVFTAVFNGTSWAAPQRRTNDSVGDSPLALVADKSAHKATLVWGRTDPVADYGLVKETFSGSPGSWSAMTAIAHTVGTGTRQPTLAIAKGTISLGFISGPPGHGKVSVGTLSGATFTPMASQPPIPEGAENLRLVRLPTGTLATADVQPLSADGAFTGEEPTLYVATNLGAGWKLTNVGPGDSPQVAFDGSKTLITFRRPDGGSLSPSTPNQIADVAVSSSGAVSKVGFITGAQAQAMPAAAAFDPSGRLQLLYASDALPDGPANRNWSWAINAVAKPLSSLESASVPLGKTVVADLKGAKVTPAVCIPGHSVTAVVTLHNPAPTAAKVAGTISWVDEGGTVSATLSTASSGVPFTKTIAGNSTATVKATYLCPSSGYALRATGVGSTPSPAFGVPGAPSNLTVGSTTAEDARLTWNLPASSTAVRELVYRHGSAGWVLEGITETTSFVDIGAGSDPSRQYMVVAVDKYGRQSRQSNVAMSS